MALKVKALWCFEMYKTTHTITQHNISEDWNLQTRAKFDFVIKSGVIPLYYPSSFNWILSISWLKENTIKHYTSNRMWYFKKATDKVQLNATVMILKNLYSNKAQGWWYLSLIFVVTEDIKLFLNYGGKFHYTLSCGCLIINLLCFIFLTDKTQQCNATLTKHLE